MVFIEGPIQVGLAIGCCESIQGAIINLWNVRVPNRFMTRAL